MVGALLAWGAEGGVVRLMKSLTSYLVCLNNRNFWKVSKLAGRGVLIWSDID